MKALVLAIVLSSPLFLLAQQIAYSSPDQEDVRKTNFEIIGKLNGKILIFKNNPKSNVISVYDNNMKALARVDLDFLPDKYVNVDLVRYPDYFYMIYEYEHKNVVHCSAVKIDASGKRMNDPVDLDTTHIGSFSSNKIYTTIYSEDKQRIMVFKINSKNSRNFVFTTHLYDAKLELIDRHRMALAMEERNDIFSDFLLDNDGVFVFSKFLKSGNGDYVSKVSIVSKLPTADTFSVKDVGAEDRVLDEIKIKVDNDNKKFILTGFYYKQKKGNIEGLYTVVWDQASDTRLRETVTVFSDELRAVAKSSESNVKIAFNDYFIKNIVVEKDGGFLLVSESQYTTSRGSQFNRWDYMYGGYNPAFMSPMDYYYSPYYNPYSPYNRYGYNSVRYYAENIMVLSFDRDGNLSWSNIVPKTQYDDESDNLISFNVMNTGGQIHFLYNQFEKRTLLLNDQSISPDGKLTRFPTLHNLDKGYDFMPRYGRQVSGKQLVIPCLYRNYLCFAKLEF